MTVWEDFELKCTDYLNQQFGKYASFMHQGGTDSTVPDILVKTLSGKIFILMPSIRLLNADNSCCSLIFRQTLLPTVCKIQPL